MATEIFLQTMTALAEGYNTFRKDKLNTLNKGEGAKIEFTFKDYVSQYYLFLETLPEEEEEEKEEESEEESEEQENDTEED